MTRTTLTALGAGSIAFAAAAYVPLGFGHRARFVFAPEGVGGDAVGDAGGDVEGGSDDLSVDSALSEAFAEVLAGNPDTHSDARPAPDTAAAGAPEPNTRETPAAGADKAPATPDHWSAEEQAAFDALPPETKTLVEKRVAAIEADYQQKTQANTEAVHLADEVRAVVDTDFQQRLEKSGMTIGQGVQYLAQMERFASTKPAEYLAFVAQTVQSMGVDVAKTLGLGGQAAAPAAGDDAFVDPTVTQLQERLDRYERQQAEQTRTRVLDDAGRQVAAVRDAKDASGNPLRPHFAEVENDMARLVRADPKMTLEAAYDAAVWSNPTVRAKVQASERAAADQKARDEAAAAQKARRGNVRTGGRSMSDTQPVDSVDDAVSQAFAEINR